MGSFDIRSALTGRNYVTAFTPFWLEDKVFYDLDAARHEHAEATDKAEVARLEERLATLEKERDESAYMLYFRAISNRANEDIISKALAAFPIKRDIYGREDEAQAIERGKFIREKQLAAHMTKIISPEGDVQTVDDDNRIDLAKALLDNAPPVSLNVIDQTIKELNKQFQMEITKQQDTDFLSKH